jgi:hypothetical protein
MNGVVKLVSYFFLLFFCIFGIVGFIILMPQVGLLKALSALVACFIFAVIFYRVPRMLVK